MADSPDLPPLPADPVPPQQTASMGAPGPVTPLPQLRSRPGAGLRALGTLVVRLVILGAGVSLGWLAGMAVAQVWPARSAAPPLTEVALRYGSQTRRKVQQLPRWWRGENGLNAAGVDPALESPGSQSAGELPSPGAAPDKPLSSAERDRIQADLTRLQQDLTGLNTRLQTLETALGETSTGNLEARLQRLDQRLDSGGTANAGSTPQTTAPQPSASNPAPTAGPVSLVPYQEPPFPLVSDRIVLPSALLFEPGSSILTASGQQLLDRIVPDLRRYGPVTLLVGSHTDPTVTAAGASQLTLQQAVAVQQHLAPQLDREGLRWVTLGYGYSRPRTSGTTPAEQQRNQRIEIGVVPGS